MQTNTGMETELKDLRIDKTSRKAKSEGSAGKWALLGLLALIVVSAAWFAYQKLTAAVPVEVVQVMAPTSIASSGAGEQTVLSATGYIVAAHKIEVASKVAGRVAFIGVDKGDQVKAGQVIVRLEDDEYRAQLEQQKGQLRNLEGKLSELTNGSRPEEVEKARADVAQGKADLENARVSLDRTKQLVADGVMSKQALDDAQAKFDGNVAKVSSLQRTLDLSVLGTRKEQIEQVMGQIEQARGGLAYAQTQLNDTVIRAPVTGTILDRNVEKGEFVTNGFVGDKGAKGYAFTMADLLDLKVELDINQNDFPKIGPTQKGIVTTDAYPDRKYKGVVDQVSPEADRAKATVQVKVKVLNPDGYLRPDMNATVAFYNEQQGNVSSETKPIVTIPAAAVWNGSVFVVVDGKARKRTVSTAGTTSKGAIIESGLIGGEELIVSAPETLKDGQRVETKH